jgi:hypothetical protein
MLFGQSGKSAVRGAYPLRDWRIEMAELLKFENTLNTEEVEAPSGQLLENAIRARDEFLRKNPELQDYQDEISRILQKIAGPNARMAALGIMMGAKLNELKDAVENLLH